MGGSGGLERFLSTSYNYGTTLKTMRATLGGVFFRGIFLLSSERTGCLMGALAYRGYGSSRGGERLNRGGYTEPLAADKSMPVARGLLA